MSDHLKAIRMAQSREPMTQERRLSARIIAPYPVRLRSTDAEGQGVREEAHLNNLSGGGLSLCLEQELAVGVYVSLAVRLSIEPEGPALRLAARGNVVRVERQPDGKYGTAIEFNQRRVL